jgi:hypothetical protein
MPNRAALIAALTSLFFFAWSLVWAQQATVKTFEIHAVSSVDGKILYKEYCQHCHGEDLRGHGPGANGLRIPPPDLTTLALRNGGKFNSGAVEDRINGWKQIPRTMGDAARRQHTFETGENPENMPVMPSFGPFFAQFYGQEVRDRQIRMTNLIRYVKSQQVSASGEPMK